MKTVSQKATECGHLSIIAASYRISGARLGNIWGIDDQNVVARGARMSANQREIRSVYAGKHLKALELGSLITSLFPLPQKVNLTNCCRILAWLMGGSEILVRDSNARPRPCLSCGCSLERTFSDHVANVRGSTLLAKDDTIATIRAQTFSHIGARFGDADIPALTDALGNLIRPPVVVNASWFLNLRGDGSPAHPHEGDRPVRSANWHELHNWWAAYAVYSMQPFSWARTA